MVSVCIHMIEDKSMSICMPYIIICPPTFNVGQYIHTNDLESILFHHVSMYEYLCNRANDELYEARKTSLQNLN